MVKKIYDIVTGSVISDRDRVVCKEYSTHRTTISHLRRGINKIVLHRLCLLENKNDLVFTLIDFQSKKEFECLTPSSFFLHFGIPYEAKAADRIYKLSVRKKLTTVINGRVYCLKERAHEVKIRNIGASRADHVFSDEVLKYRDFSKKQHTIKNILGSRIRQALDRVLWKKSKSTIELTGCSIPFLLSYLESLFLPGMTWENRGKGTGKWHIDHIKPCNTFNLTIEEEQKRCFHYSNLRPLWGSDNIKRPLDGSDMFGYGIGI